MMTVTKPIVRGLSYFAGFGFAELATIRCLYQFYRHFQAGTEWSMGQAVTEI